MLALRAPEKGLELACLVDPAVPAAACGATRAGCGRCSRTWSATPSSSPSAARWSLHVVGASEEDAARAGPLRRARHRHRHPARQGRRRSSSPSRRSTRRPPGGSAAPASACRSRSASRGLMGGHDRRRERGGPGLDVLVHGAAATAAGALRPTPPAGADLGGLRVLVVDDNETNHRVLAGLLDAWECRHAHVADGPAALARLREAAAERRPVPRGHPRHDDAGDGRGGARRVKCRRTRRYRPPRS